jgi:hypothetical protein
MSASLEKFSERWESCSNEERLLYSSKVKSLLDKKASLNNPIVNKTNNNYYTTLLKAITYMN